MSKTEQDARIREAFDDYLSNPEDYTTDDLEDIFEDRDPIEFM